MAYVNVSENYNEVIYSGDAKTRPILKINNIVVNDLDTPVADNTISSIVKTHNILKTGNNRFSLDNFVAQELEIQIYDFDYSIYANPSLGANQYNVIDLSLSTLTSTQELSTITEEIWETVQIGIFNIIGTPTTDKGLTTIKAKCNRIKFDIPYNAKPIIDENDGKIQIGALLQDICLKCGVELGTELPFTNSTSEIGVYDSTVKANVHVSYIGELAGCIAVLGRDGKLYLIPINNDLYKHIIDVDLIKGQGTLILSDSFTFDRVCYEFGINKYATPQNETPNTTIYINSANPYVSTQEEIDNIYNEVVGFNIKNLRFETMGNPCIDAWDIVSFTKDNIEHKTLANNTLIYNGVLMQKFDTSIGTKETVKENVTIIGEDTYKKTIATELNNINATLTTTITKVDENGSDITTLKADVGGFSVTIAKVDQLDSDLNTLEDQYTEVTTNIEGINTKISKLGGNNTVKNSVGIYKTDWDVLHDSSDTTEIKNQTNSKHAWLLQNKTSIQDIQVLNNTWTISWRYKKLITLAECKLIINDIEYELTEEEWTNDYTTIEVSDNKITIQIVSDTDDSCYLGDLMCNQGEVASVWSSAPGESVNGGVKIGQSIEITSSASNIKQVMDNDGNRIINIDTDETVAEYTDDGMSTKKITSAEAEISNLLFLDMGEQTWVSRI